MTAADSSSHGPKYPDPSQSPTVNHRVVQRTPAGHFARAVAIVAKAEESGTRLGATRSCSRRLPILHSTRGGSGGASATMAVIGGGLDLVSSDNRALAESISSRAALVSVKAREQRA